MEMSLKIFLFKWLEVIIPKLCLKQCTHSLSIVINENSDGQFVDDSIAHSEFKAKLSANSKFLESIPRIGTLVGRKYEMLQRILDSKPKS